MRWIQAGVEDQVDCRWSIAAKGLHWEGLVYLERLARNSQFPLSPLLDAQFKA